MHEVIPLTGGGGGKQATDTCSKKYEDKHGCSKTVVSKSDSGRQ